MSPSPNEIRKTGSGYSDRASLAAGDAHSSVPRVGIVEPLRGLAALAVAWFHFTNGAGLLSEGWLRSTGAYGWLGVEVFFVISGFIIPFALYHSGYRFPDHAGRFILKRIVRLDPPYLVAIVATIVLWYVSAAAPGFLGTAPKIEWLPLLLHLGYLNAFFGFPWVIPVLWTLAIEFQFYLLMSISFPLVVHRSWIVRLALLGAFCGLPFVIRGEAFVFSYLALFAVGILTCQKFIGLLSTRAFLLQLPLATTAAAVSLGPDKAVAGLLTALVIALVKLPKLAPLAFLGSVSYSLYLLHTPIGGRVVNLGARWAHDTISRMAVLLVALAVSLGASYLMYRFVERPARRWSSSLRYRRKTAGTGESALPAPDLSGS